MDNIEAIAAGGYHSLALKANGCVVAWGRNHFGQTNVPPGLSNVVAIAAGELHSVALRADGQIVAWGYNHDGQADVPPGLSSVTAIAAGTTHSLALRADGSVVGWGQFSRAAVPSGLSNVVAIAAGGHHSLVLKADGSVLAWGDNTYGQAAVPPGLSNVVAVAAGYLHSLALQVDGHIVGWGYNPYGQADVPPGLSNVTAIAGGGYHSLALKVDGGVVAWGYYSLTNLPAGLSGAAAIAAGREHSLALVSEGPVQVRLENQAVPYTSNATFTPFVTGREPFSYQWFRILEYSGALRSLPNATNATLTISNAQFSDIGTYAVLVSNGFGSVLSSGATLTVTSPPFITGQPQDWTETVGGDVSLVVSASGTPPLSYQWRFNGTDLPGATNPELRRNNVQKASSGLYSVLVTNLYGNVQSAEARLTVTDGPPHIGRHPTSQVAWIGGSATLAASATGSPPLSYQWRWNGEDIPDATGEVLTLKQLRYEQAGYYNVRVANPFGETVSYKAFLSIVQVMGWPSDYGFPTNFLAGLTNVTALSVGDYHVLALKADRTVAVWVADSYYADRSVTNVPPGLNEAVGITAGSAFNLVLRANGTVVAWGNNSSGQTRVPTGLSNVTAVAAGGRHVLALKTNGTVVAWGDNALGQAQVPAGLSNVTAVAAGAYHSLALKADGTVTGWGDNSSGQINVPLSASNVIAIAAGRHSMALRQDGTVVVWGSYPLSPPTGLSNVVAIALGSSQILALRRDGTVVGWGTGSAAVPPGLTNVVAIAAGGSSCPSVAAVGNGAPAFTLHPASQSATLGGVVQLHARAAGVPPLSYQWQLNGQSLSGATDADLVLEDVQRTTLGEYRVVASNALGSTVSATALITLPYSGTLAAALNATNLVWTNTVATNAPWFGQMQESHDGDAAAQSGSIGPNRQSSLETTVIGPGTLTLWWKVSSEEGYDLLKLLMDGAATPLASISGETEWEQKIISVPAGSHKLSWVYAKDGSVSNGRDAGWLDEVTFVSAPPVITGHPMSQIQSMGGSALFTVSASGAPPLSYQWTKTGADLPGASGNVLTLTNLARQDTAAYAVRVSNAGGSTLSSNALLTVRVPQRLTVPRVLPDGSMVLTSADADGRALLPMDLPGFDAQASTNLVHWTPLPGALTLTNGLLLLRDASCSNYPARFYRIVEQ